MEKCLQVFGRGETTDMPLRGRFGTCEVRPDEDENRRRNMYDVRTSVDDMRRHFKQLTKRNVSLEVFCTKDSVNFGDDSHSSVVCFCSCLICYHYFAFYDLKVIFCCSCVIYKKKFITICGNNPAPSK